MKIQLIDYQLDFNAMDSFYGTPQSYVLMNPFKKPATEAHGLPIYQPQYYQSSVIPATSELKFSTGNKLRRKRKN